MRVRAVDAGSAFGAVAGSVASAAAALCCVGPLALTLLGVNGMILAAGIKPFRGYSLREVEGFSTPEICKILDVTRTNFGVVLYRARNGLRECLEEKGMGRSHADL